LNCGSLKLSPRTAPFLAAIGLFVAPLLAWPKAAPAQMVVLKGPDSNVVAVVKIEKPPSVVVVNPVTNKIYVASGNTNDVTVIDGETNSPATIKVGFDPQAIAVNQVTDKIYVACGGDKNIWIVDGATNATTKVAMGKSGADVAVNPVTNKIYVANQENKSVTVVDGATTATANIEVEAEPTFVAVNSVTNKIYVASLMQGKSGTVTIIDGATNNTTEVATVLGAGPLAVNSVTNKIYVIHRSLWGIYYNTSSCFFHFGTACTNRDGGVTVIDGGTNQITTVPTGTDPATIALNSVTNKVYIAETGDETVGELTILDGATNKVMSMNVPGAPGLPAVAANSVANKVYVTFPGYHKDDESFAAGSMIVIDGATNEAVAKSYDSKVQPYGVAINEVTNRVYVINRGSKDVTVMIGFTADATPPAPPTIDPL